MKLMDKMMSILYKSTLNFQEEDFCFRSGTADEGIFNAVVHGNEYHLPDKLNPKDIIIDVGCHIGSFSYACLIRGARNIHSYEALKQNYDVAMENLRRGINNRNIQLLNKAVFRSDLPEDELLLTPSATDNNSGGVSVIWHRNAELDSAGKVWTVGLDKIIDIVKKIKLLKLDCEGSEFQFC